VGIPAWVNALFCLDAGTEGFDQFGDFSFSRDRSALFRDRPTNIFQIKGTCWIGR